jgi:hypothetical protein
LRHNFAKARLLLALQISAPEVLVGTSVAALTGWHAVAIYAKGLHVVSAVHGLFTLATTNYTCVVVATCLVEVLGSVCCGVHRRSVEVVKHQVHVFLLFGIQIVPYFDVPMHLNLDVSVRLP